MRRFLLPLPVLACLVLLPATGAQAAGKRCNNTHGTELAHSTVVKIYKVKTGNSYRFYGCKKSTGPVVALTKPFTGNKVKMVAAKGAYAAFTRTISGSDTISVVDARTGKQRHGLFPPDDIEFDVDPATPQIAAARINTKGELVVSYIGLGQGDSTASQIYVYAFDAAGHEQLLDSDTSSKLAARSIAINGETVTWQHGGETRTAKIGETSLSVTSGGGPTAGDVTTSPEGLACHIAGATLTGTCVGSFSPDDYVTVTATGPATSTVTIAGACSAVHAPVAGQASSVAQCSVHMDQAQAVKVTFS